MSSKIIISNLTANPTATGLTTSIFVGLALLGAPLISLYFTDRHEVSDAGLKYNTILGQRREMRWADVTSLRYSLLMKWFELRGADGQVARLSAALKGLPEFARVALPHITADAIDERTARIMRATADGNPPAIW